MATDHDRETRLAELRRVIDVAWQQVDRGEMIVLQDECAAEAFYEDIKRRGRARLPMRGEDG